MENNDVIAWYALGNGGGVVHNGTFAIFPFNVFSGFGNMNGSLLFVTFNRNAGGLSHFIGSRGSFVGILACWGLGVNFNSLQIGYFKGNIGLWVCVNFIDVATNHREGRWGSGWGRQGGFMLQLRFNFLSIFCWRVVRCLVLGFGGDHVLLGGYGVLVVFVLGAFTGARSMYCGFGMYVVLYFFAMFV